MKMRIHSLTVGGTYRNTAVVVNPALKKINKSQPKHLNLNLLLLFKDKNSI